MNIRSSKIKMLSSSPSAMLPSPTSSTSSESLPARRKPRVSAEHTLNRVRENQRRHRARRKDYIASLEEKLAETEKQLAEARAEIAALKAEREGHALECKKEEVHDEDTPIEDVREEERDVGTDKTMDLEGIDLTPPASESASTFEHPAVPNDAAFLGSFYMLDNLPTPNPIDLPLDLPLDPQLEATPPSGPPPCCEAEPALASSDPTDLECVSCKTRPPPAPSESTTLCAQAYVMIQQQNFRGIDATTIRLWLYQGFRRAQREGEGCRVENGALFRLLDYISGI